MIESRIGVPPFTPQNEQRSPGPCLSVNSSLPRPFSCRNTKLPYSFASDFSEAHAPPFQTLLFIASPRSMFSILASCRASGGTKNKHRHTVPINAEAAFYFSFPGGLDCKKVETNQNFETGIVCCTTWLKCKMDVVTGDDCPSHLHGHFGIYGIH